MTEAEFSVSGFRQRSHKRSVKDKKNCFYVESVKEQIMRSERTFKSSPEIREYWKLQKRKERSEK